MTYTYQHYPLWVTPPGGVPCLVNDAEQETAVMNVASQPEPGPQGAGKDTLRAEAAALGVTVDGRWSVDRLNAEIAAARAAQLEQSP